MLLWCLGLCTVCCHGCCFIMWICMSAFICEHVQQTNIMLRVFVCLSYCLLCVFFFLLSFPISAGGKGLRRVSAHGARYWGYWEQWTSEAHSCVLTTETNIHSAPITALATRFYENPLMLFSMTERTVALVKHHTGFSFLNRHTTHSYHNVLYFALKLK